jgi:hypothetical protein
MPQSDSAPIAEARRRDSPGSNAPRGIDWRGWLILAWVVWFGVLYGKMMVAERGQRAREMIVAVAKALHFE